MAELLRSIPHFADGGGVRVMGYGPAYGEYGQVTGNHGNALQMDDYAVSPNLADGHHPGEEFELLRDGKVVRRGFYNDASYYTPGHPT